MRGGAPFVPQWEDRVIKWAVIRWRRQTGLQKVGGIIRAYKIKAPTGTDVDSIKGLIIQHEWEWQGYRCLAPDAVIARVGSPRHDRVSSGCYRVAIRAIGNVAADHAINRSSQGWRLCLARASRSGRGEERQKDSSEEDKQECASNEMRFSSWVNLFFHRPDLRVQDCVSFSSAELRTWWRSRARSWS